MAGAGSFAEMQLSIYWHGVDGWGDEMQNKASLSKLPASLELAIH